MRNIAVPAGSGWNPWWIAMWWTLTPLWVFYGIVTHGFTRGATAFLALFVLPELISLAKADDGLPPLTHVIRNGIDNVQLSLPLITGVCGGVIASWANATYRLIGFAALAAGALGWLIAHFLAVYAVRELHPSEVRRRAHTRAV